MHFQALIWCLKHTISNFPLLVFCSVLLNGYDFISQIAVRSPYYNSDILPFCLRRDVPQGSVLGSGLLFLYINDLLLLFFQSLKSYSMLLISLVGPPPLTLNVNPRLYSQPSTNWWNSPLSGVYFLSPSNVSHRSLARPLPIQS